MSLDDELAKAREASKERIPEPVRVVMAKARDDLKASGIAGRALKPGAKAPTFRLPNAAGRQVDLAALLEKGPVVISFYRGGWCPYCNLELKALQDRLPEIEALGASLVAVTPEQPDGTKATVEKLDLGFEVLSDAGNAAARDYGLVFEITGDMRAVYDKMGLDLAQKNGDDSWELPVPGTFVLSKSGDVVEAYADPDHRYRLDPEKVVAALKDLSAQ
jgi:peroxiredoxin